jgi:HEAT repeat protein
MENFARIRFASLLVFFVSIGGTVAAQEFPATLLQAYPPSVEKLNSEDVGQRASVLKELVFHVPQSCTLELGLRFNLPRADYVFVVNRILEGDLRSLDEKSKRENWTFLSHLITKFEMREFASAVANYIDDPDWQIQGAVIQTLRQLREVGFDGKLSPLLYADHAYVRQLALETLIEFHSKKAIPVLISKLLGKDSSEKRWALDKLAEIGAVDAGPSIAEKLSDEDKDIRYWAIDTLARLNAKAQAPSLWQFLEHNTDKKLEGFAIATLVYFEQKAAVPLVVQNLRAIASGSQEYDVLEFIRKLKPKFLIPELISLYNTKTKFFESATEEKRFREQVLQLLFEYRSPLAIPVYRENLIDRSDGRVRPNPYVAELLQQLNAVEALDDIILCFTDLVKSLSPGSENDYYAGQFGIVLAKFGDKKVWKMLVEYLEKSAYYDRERIFIELNKQLDRRLWDELHAIKPSQQLAPVNTVVENLSRETGIPITIADIPRADVCSPEPTSDKEAIACGYSNPEHSLHENLETIISIVNNKHRGQYTFIYDKGTIRILSVKDAVEFWKRNILNIG